MIDLSFVKAHDSGRHCVVVRESAAGIRWDDVARAMCSVRTGVGAGALVVTAGRGVDEFWLRTYDLHGGRMLPCDATIRSSARAIHHIYGLRRLVLRVFRYRYEVEVGPTRTETILHHQAIPAGPYPLHLPGIGQDLSCYSTGVGRGRLVAVVDSSRIGHLVRPMSDPRFSLAEILDHSTLRLSTYDAGHRVVADGADAVAAVAVGEYLGRLAGDRIRVYVSPARLLSVRVDPARPDAAKRVSGTGAVVCTGEFSWPYPSR